MKGKVPAVEKCFFILDEIAKSKEPLTFKDISKKVNLNKSTIFNILTTLVELNVLEKLDNKYKFGTKFFVLAKKAGEDNNLINLVNPFIKKISEYTNLSVFFGTIEGNKAIILDKVDSKDDIKVSSEIGMKIPLFAGSHGKALASLLDDDILKNIELRRFTKNSIVELRQFLNEVEKVKKNKVAYDNEEYIPGIKSIAVPIRINSINKPYAIWAVGLSYLFTSEKLKKYVKFLKKIATEIEIKINQ